MKVYCVQHDIAWEDKAANHARVGRLLREQMPEAGSLIVLAEMFATGFSFNIGATAEPEDGPTHGFLASLAREHRCHVLGGVVTPAGNGRGRNQAVVYGPDASLVGRYQKIHPFAPGGELACHQPGDSLFSFDWAGFRVSPLICYDLRFPELFRRAIRGGTTLFAVIASWPLPREEHWVRLLQARAIENQAYVAGVNRCGSDPKHRYPGRSLIAAPQGHVIADAGEEQMVVSARVDLEELKRYRREMPFLADMELDCPA